MAVNLSLLNSSTQNNINTNFERVASALADTVGRSGRTPNQMNADFDLNSNSLLNAAEVYTNNLYIDGNLVIPTNLGSYEGGIIGTSNLVDLAVTVSKLEQVLQDGLGLVFDTRADAIASFIPAIAQHIRLAGRTSAGDLGGGLFRRSGSAGTLSFQSADGAHWVFVGGTAFPQVAGAIGNGVVDDTAALQTLASAGLLILLPSGFTFRTVNTFVFATSGGIQGLEKGKSFIVNDHPTNDVISVTATEPMVFKDFRLLGYSGKTAGSGIIFNTAVGFNSRSRIEGVEFILLPYGVFTFNAINWGVNDCYFADCYQAGVWVQNDNAPDGGDSYITNSTFVCTIYTGQGAAVVQKNSGGLKFTGNKILQGKYGILLSLTGGVTAPTQSTSILIITDNSIEHCNAAAIYIERDGSADVSIAFSQVIIGNNQINCAEAPPGALLPRGIYTTNNISIMSMTITGNTIQLDPSGGDAITLAKVTSFIILGNTITGFGGTTKGIETGATSYGTIGVNTYVNITFPEAFGGPVIRADRATQRGIETKNPTVAYPPFFISAPQYVAFAKPFLEIPFVTGVVSNSASGGISFLVNRAATTMNGFEYLVTARDNVSTVEIEWEATGIM